MGIVLRETWENMTLPFKTCPVKYSVPARERMCILGKWNPRLHFCGFGRSQLRQCDCATHGPVSMSPPGNTGGAQPSLWLIPHDIGKKSDNRVGYFLCIKKQPCIRWRGALPMRSCCLYSNYELMQFYSRDFFNHTATRGRKLEYYLCNYQGSFSSANRQKVGLIIVLYPLFQPLCLATSCATYTVGAHFPFASQQTIKSYLKNYSRFEKYMK